MNICSLLIAFVMSASGWSSGPVPSIDVETQNRVFQELWGEQFSWKFNELPTEGTVPEFRLPYAGYIYPDSAGGTYRAVQKYDQAFYPGRSRAAAWEQADIAAHRQAIMRQASRGGFLFGRRTVMVQSFGTPHWHGHCNGWTAAAIRHGEPKRSVTKNGVVFAPSDIKGLLAELYTFCDIVDLGGENYGNVHPGTLHAVLANWLGRQSHPIAMEATPGREKWNYPIYAFATSSATRSGGRQVEVKMNLKYASNINREHDQAPANARTKYFHYLLDLDASGDIVGGRFFADSSQIDLLWVPRQPVPGGQEGNQLGNPHLNVGEVLALWRASVDPDLRDRWVNVDPAPDERGVIVRAAAPPQSVARSDTDNPPLDDVSPASPLNDPSLTGGGASDTPTAASGP